MVHAAITSVYDFATMKARKLPAKPKATKLQSYLTPSTVMQWHTIGMASIAFCRGFLSARGLLGIKDTCLLAPEAPTGQLNSVLVISLMQVCINWCMWFRPGKEFRIQCAPVLPNWCSPQTQSTLIPALIPLFPPLPSPAHSTNHFPASL